MKFIRFRQVAFARFGRLTHGLEDRKLEVGIGHMLAVEAGID